MDTQSHENATTIDFIFALIRHVLFGYELQPKDFPEKIDWEKTIAIANKQTVLGIICESIPSLPTEARPPLKTLQKLMAAMLRNEGAHSRINKSLAKAVSHLEAKGIPSVLLKGQGIAMRYPKPSMRQCGDIDLYVGDERYADAYNALSEKWEGYDEVALEDEKHTHFHIDEILLELHQFCAVFATPWHNSKFQKWAKEELHDPQRLKKAVFEGVQVHLPSPTFNAFFIFYHLWHHFITSGVGLRQICDWALVLHTQKDEIDKAKLLEMVESCGLTKAWQTIGCIAVEKIGLPADEMPAYNPGRSLQGEKALKDILIGGNFGHYAPDRNKAKQGQSGLVQGYHRVRHWVMSFCKRFNYAPVEVSFHSLHILRFVVKAKLQNKPTK